MWRVSCGVWRVCVRVTVQLQLGLDASAKADVPELAEDEEEEKKEDKEEEKEEKEEEKSEGEDGAAEERKDEL